MENVPFELPQTPAFAIPYNPHKLRFQSDFMDKQRFQKLQIDRKLIKAFSNHLMDKIDKDVLFYLKFTGQGDSLIKYENNKVSYYRNKQLFNAGIAPFENPVDVGTTALWHLKETSGEVANDETGTYNLAVSGGPIMDAEGKVMSPASNFDGDDDYMVDTTPGTLLDTFPSNGSIEMWWKPNITYDSSDPTIKIFIQKINKPAGTPYTDWMEWRINDLGSFVFVNANTTDGTVAAVSTQQSWTSGTWYHMATLWGPSNIWGSAGMKNIINGVVDGTNAATNILDTGATGNFTLGASLLPGGLDYLTNCVMDEVRISSFQRERFGGIAPGVIL